jgi:hypothetical protein
MTRFTSEALKKFGRRALSAAMTRQRSNSLGVTSLWRGSATWGTFDELVFEEVVVGTGREDGNANRTGCPSRRTAHIEDAGLQ